MLSAASEGLDAEQEKGGKIYHRPISRFMSPFPRLSAVRYDGYRYSAPEV